MLNYNQNPNKFSNTWVCVCVCDSISIKLLNFDACRVKVIVLKSDFQVNIMFISFMLCFHKRIHICFAWICIRCARGKQRTLARECERASALIQMWNILKVYAMHKDPNINKKLCPNERLFMPGGQCHCLYIHGSSRILRCLSRLMVAFSLFIKCAHDNILYTVHTHRNALCLSNAWNFIFSALEIQ